MASASAMAPSKRKLPSIQQRSSMEDNTSDLKRDMDTVGGITHKGRGPGVGIRYHWHSHPSAPPQMTTSSLLLWWNEWSRPPLPKPKSSLVSLIQPAITCLCELISSPSWTLHSDGKEGMFSLHEPNTLGGGLKWRQGVSCSEGGGW